MQRCFILKGFLLLLVGFLKYNSQIALCLWFVVVIAASPLILDKLPHFDFLNALVFVSLFQATINPFLSKLSENKH